MSLLSTNVQVAAVDDMHDFNILSIRNECTVVEGGRVVVNRMFIFKKGKIR